jgi:hypothetical protein
LEDLADHIIQIHHACAAIPPAGVLMGGVQRVQNAWVVEKTRRELLLAQLLDIAVGTAPDSCRFHDGR